MEQIIAQLESVRRYGRALLFAQQILLWVAVSLGSAFVCGLIDYALRLPGWLRLAIGVPIVVVAMVWIIARLARVARFWPDLSVLAQRAERLYPQLAGVLASGVEFAIHRRDYAQPQTTDLLAQASIDRAQHCSHGVALGRLVTPAKTIRCGLLALLAMCAVGGTAMAAPEFSWIAAQRWFVPLGDIQWPRRTALHSGIVAEVWPADSPVRLEARVSRGYRPGMRAWAIFRLVGQPDGERTWQSVLMSDQNTAANVDVGPDHSDREGLFEHILELSSELGEGSPNGSAGATDVNLEFYFEAGDARTRIQRLQLEPRPAVQSVTVRITPPDYAGEMVDPQNVALHRQTGRVATVAALEGSKVDFYLELNKPVPDPDGNHASLLPGFGNLTDAELVSHLAETRSAAPWLKLSFTLHQSLETTIQLRDRFGLESLSERRYQIEALADKPPRVAMSDPATDEEVLSSAVVDLAALARDDVAVESIRMEAQRSDQSVVHDLARVEGRRNRLAAEHRFELAPLELTPGDELVLTALAQDIYDFNGQRHEPVRSSPRHLRVIGDTELVAQIRNELAGLRRQVIRMIVQQKKLIDVEPELASSGQQRLTRQLEAQTDMVSGLDRRMQRNRLQDSQLSQLMARSASLLGAAQESSRAAVTNMKRAAQPNQDASRTKQHRQHVQESQHIVGQQLEALVSLLDQGRDALALQNQLRELDAQQQNLLAETRTLIPRTLGQSKDQLEPADRSRLADLRGQQGALAEQADRLARRMQVTAETLALQEESTARQASAAALADALAIAQRQGLAPRMTEAAQAVDQNQLSRSAQLQTEALETLRQMLEQIQQTEARRQEILRRMLEDLSQAIARLVNQQQAQLGRLTEATELSGLDAPLSVLRRNTLSVEQSARTTRESVEVAALLDRAASYQGDAIAALRTRQREPAMTGQSEALSALELALGKVKQLRDQAQDQLTRQQRGALIASYRQLSQQQEVLRERARALFNAKTPGRRQKAALIEIGYEQMDLRIAAREVGQQVGQTVVLAHIHQRIDAVAREVSQRLHKAQTEPAILDQQQQVASLLRTVATSLEQAPQSSPFASSSGGSGGGGGRGPTQQGVPPPLVPPLAELKALRGLQETIYTFTRQLSETDERGDVQWRSRLVDLADQQEKLESLGARLMKQMQPHKPSDREP